MIAAPKKLKIGHVVVTVIKEKGLGDKAGVAGICGEDTQTIHFDADLGPDIERETVLHESLHHIWHQSTLDKLFTDEQEEQVVWTLAPWLMQLIHDNPKFVEFLCQQ